MTMMMMYWLVILSGIKAVFMMGSIVAIFIGLMMLGCAADDGNKKLIKHSLCVISIACVMLIAGVLTPTTKQAVAIWAVPKIINNEDVQGIAKNAPEFINKQLQSWIDDLGEEVTE